MLQYIHFFCKKQCCGYLEKRLIRVKKKKTCYEKNGLYVHVFFHIGEKNKAENVNKRRKEIVNGYIWVNEHQIVHETIIKQSTKELPV